MSAIASGPISISSITINHTHRNRIMSGAISILAIVLSLGCIAFMAVVSINSPKEFIRILDARLQEKAPVAVPVTPHKRPEQRAFVYTMGESSIPAEEALHRLTLDGWQVDQISGFTPSGPGEVSALMLLSRPGR